MKQERFMEQERLKKLENLSKKLISGFILDTLEDSEKTFGIITVTDIKISPDLSYLDVFVSSFLNSEKLTKTLAQHNNEIQAKLYKKINIRKLPRIRYRYDNSGKIGQDICYTINNELN